MESSTRRNRRQRFLQAMGTAIFLVAGATACTAPVTETPAMATLTGKVFYRERITLPPGSVVEVHLEDVSRADAPAGVLASDTLAADGAPPYPFRLEYDPGTVREGRRYGLRARIVHEGRLLFINDTHIDPFASGPTGPVDALVVQVAHRGGTTPLKGTRWTLVELDGEPVGQLPPGRAAYLVLDPEGGRVHGYGGCNGFTGSYTVAGAALEFSGLASTLMACAEGMELEKAFLGKLPGVYRCQVAGDTLVLYAENRPVARFREAASP